MDLLNLSTSFGKSFDNIFNKKLFLLTISSIFLLVNLYFSQNLFVVQSTNQNINLDTNSIAKFNTMQLSIFLKSNIDNL